MCANGKCFEFHITPAEPARRPEFTTQRRAQCALRHPGVRARYPRAGEPRDSAASRSMVVGSVLQFVATVARLQLNVVCTHAGFTDYSGARRCSCRNASAGPSTSAPRACAHSFSRITATVPPRDSIGALRIARAQAAGTEVWNFSLRRPGGTAVNCLNALARDPQVTFQSPPHLHAANRRENTAHTMIKLTSHD